MFSVIYGEGDVLGQVRGAVLHPVFEGLFAEGDLYAIIVLHVAVTFYVIEGLAFVVNVECWTDEMSHDLFHFVLLVVVFASASCGVADFWGTLLQDMEGKHAFELLHHL